MRALTRARQRRSLGVLRRRVEINLNGNCASPASRFSMSCSRGVPPRPGEHLIRTSAGL